MQGLRTAAWPFLSHSGFRQGVRGLLGAHVLGLPVSETSLGCTSGSAWVTVFQDEDPESQGVRTKTQQWEVGVVEISSDLTWTVRPLSVARWL